MTRLLVCAVLGVLVGYVLARTVKTNKGRINIMLQLTDIQSVGLTVGAVDAKGNPTTLTEVPTWASSDPAILTVAAAADGMSATAVAVGPEGAAQVQVNVVVGGATLNGTLDVTVVGSAATALVITPGTPQ